MHGYNQGTFCKTHNLCIGNILRALCIYIIIMSAFSSVLFIPFGYIDVVSYTNDNHALIIP